MGGKGQAVWAPVPAAPQVLRPRDGHSTPGPGAPALGSRSAGERRARRQRPPGSDARSLLWLRRGHRPRVPSPVRLAATLPLTGRSPSVPNPSGAATGWSQRTAVRGPGVMRPSPWPCEPPARPGHRCARRRALVSVPITDARALPQRAPARGGGSGPDVCTQARGIAHTVHYDPACSGKGQKRAHGPRGPSAGRSGGGPRPGTGLGGGLPPRPFQCV